MHQRFKKKSYILHNTYKSKPYYLSDHATTVADSRLLIDAAAAEANRLRTMLEIPLEVVPGRLYPAFSSYLPV